MSAVPNPYQEQAVGEANAWVARFAPLIMEEEAIDQAEVKRRLQTVRELQQTGVALRDRLTSVAGPEEQELTATLHSAIDQLPTVESDLRSRLGRLAPGDPDGTVDLDALQDKLAERAARNEVGVPTELAQPSKLDFKICPGNKAMASFLGIFALGWNSFTAFHATLMIGGMFHAFGWGALALLGFYGIFFAAGFGLVMAALNAASDESIAVDHDELTVSRKLGSWIRKKEYKLGPDSRAEISLDAGTGFSSGSNRNTPKPAIVITDVNGSQIVVGSSATDLQRQTAVQKINAYLEAQK